MLFRLCTGQDVLCRVRHRGINSKTVEVTYVLSHTKSVDVAMSPIFLEWILVLKNHPYPESSQPPKPLSAKLSPQQQISSLAHHSQTARPLPLLRFAVAAPKTTPPEAKPTPNNPKPQTLANRTTHPPPRSSPAHPRPSSIVYSKISE